MRKIGLMVGLALAALLLPELAEAKRCRCPQGIVHTFDSCAEACGYRSTSKRRRQEAREKAAHDYRADRQHRRAQAARAASGTSPTRPYVPHRRGVPVPAQQGLTNVDERPLPTDLSGVFCSEGDVIVPKRPSREMRDFCRRK